MANKEKFDASMRLLHRAEQTQRSILEQEYCYNVDFIAEAKNMQPHISKEQLDVVARYMAAVLAEDLALETILEE